MKRKIPALVAYGLIAWPSFGSCERIPVRCGQPSDVALPHESPAPRLSAAQAEALAKAGQADPSFISMTEPANFGIYRYTIADYADCIGVGGCYWDDLEKQSKRAQTELDRLVATRKPGERLAMVLDIDETSLSSYCEEKREGFGYFAPAFEAWVVSPQASIPLPGTLALFNQARAAQVSVFFITGRSHEQAEATARNLKAAGYSDWQGLILRNEDERTLDTVVYKASERAKIVAQGYRLVMNVGDQWSDLNGKPKAEISVKLPNPFYYLPGAPGN